MILNIRITMNTRLNGMLNISISNISRRNIGRSNFLVIWTY